MSYCLTLRTLKSTIVPSYHLRFYNYWVGMVYYIYIYYYIYYNIYNNIYKSIEDIKGAKSISRWYNGTMVQYRFCGFSVSSLESGSKITRIWGIEVRNLGDTLRQAQGPFPRQAISLFNIWNKLGISFFKVGISRLFFVPLQCIWEKCIAIPVSDKAGGGDPM